MTDVPATTRWPEGAVVYQIYPRSFQDSNGDGIGDIPGIISRLDYLQELGINAIWLSPFYPSPMADFGYDVADYCDVDPMFGTLDDFKQLVDQAELRKIKIIVDLVPNHSSNEHAWFKSSRASADSEHADWYIWRDGKTDEAGQHTPPNNWVSVFNGESAWEWDDSRQQFYLHSFDKAQPDLNWSNPDVRAAMKDVMRFWLDLGISGFRVDAVYWMGKDPMLHDDKLNPDYNPETDDKSNAVLHTNSRGWPMVYSYLSEMAKVLQEPKYAANEPFMVTEAYPDRHNPVASYMSFYVGMDPEVAAPFNFEGLSLPWEAKPWRNFLRSFHHTLEIFNHHCVASYAFGNHDQARLCSRLGEAAARGVAVMSLTLPGMIFIYNGEELGMHNVDVPPELVQDPAAIGATGRDPFRTPMQWSAAEQAGFTAAEHPWLPVAEDYREHNAESESQDHASFLNLYRALTSARNQHPVLRTGHLEVLDVGCDDLVCYVRYAQDSDDAYMTLINFSDTPTACVLPESISVLQHLVSSTGPREVSVQSTGEVEVEAYEGNLFLVSYRRQG